MKYFYQGLSVLCDLPHLVTTEAGVGDPGEGGHGVRLGEDVEHGPVCELPHHGAGEEEGDKLAG